MLFCTTNLNYDYSQDSAAQDYLDRKITLVRGRRDSLTATESMISQSQTILNAALSQFRPLASIQRLPNELLSRVFNLAIPPYCRWAQFDDPDILLDITSVCRRWRKLAIQTPSLWSHVDFYLTDYEKDPPPPRIEQMWLERAKGTPLHLVEILVPYASQIITLELFYFELRYIIETLTEIRLAQGITNPINTLHINGTGPTGSSRSNSPTPAWPASLFKGLSEIHIGELGEIHCPTLYQLASILNYADTRNYPRVHLPHLRFLGLHGVFQHNQRNILSILQPVAWSCILKSTCIWTTNDFAATTSFITTFHVTSLCLWPPPWFNYDNPEIKRYLPFAQAVHTLLIPLEEGGTDEQLDALLTTNQAGASLPRLPNLKTLCLMAARFWPSGIKSLEKVVSTYSLNKIALIACGTGLSHARGPGDERLRIKFEGMLQRIPQRVPEFVFEHGYVFGSNGPWHMRLQKRLIGLID
ncbi:F-box-like [Rhizoctonia solani]|uniref:F-box-like n=1 Tax=Rhizoctonia solani TaxID=456999 RepID=A0A8H7LWY8_9AGAM|nr:F-box-like [Rhizoctonia solani]